MISKAGLKHVFMGMLAVILAFSTTSIAYAETTPGVEVVNAGSQVTVHVFNNNNNSPDAEGSGEEISDTASLGTAINGATLSYYKVGELVQYTTNGLTSLKYAVSESAAAIFGWSTDGKTEVTISNGTDVKYYLFDANELSGLLSNATSSDLKGKGDSGSWTDLTTDENGSASTSDTLSGLYLFVGKSMPEGVTTEVAPFFVSAPMPADGSWNTAIHVYPKVQTAGMLSISKTVNNAKSMSANSGTSLNYQIAVTIPKEAKNFSSFKIEDVIPDGLDVVDGSVSVSTNGEVTLQTDEYQLISSNGSISFELINEGLDAFDNAEECILTISYNAYINQNATLATAITNTANFTYAYVGGAVSEDSDSATVYTYGIDLTKTFEGATAYPTNGNAQFSLYTDEDCKTAVAVSGSDGSYWVDAVSQSSTTEMSVAQLNETNNGVLTIKGLAEGTYYLKETSAPDGYGKIQDPIEITISKGGDGELSYQINNPTATVNNVSATINAGGSADKAGLVQLTVENQKLLFGFLPKTGDVGTFIFIAAGIGLVCAAVVYLTSRRRKNISNSH